MATAKFDCMQKHAALEDGQVPITVLYSGITGATSSASPNNLFPTAEYESVASYSMALTPCDNNGIPIGDTDITDYSTSPFEYLSDSTSSQGTRYGGQIINVTLDKNDVLYGCQFDFTTDLSDSDPFISSNYFYIMGNEAVAPTVSINTAWNGPDTCIPISVDWNNLALAQKCITIRDKFTQSIVGRIQLVTTNAAIAAVMDGNVIVTPAIPAKTIMYNNEGGMQNFVLCTDWPTEATAAWTYLTGFTEQSTISARVNPETKVIWVKLSNLPINKRYTIGASSLTRGLVKKTSETVEVGYAPGRPKAPTDIIAKLVRNETTPNQVQLYFKPPADVNALSNEINLSQPNGLTFQNYEVTVGTDAAFRLDGTKIFSQHPAAGPELSNFLGAANAPRLVTGGNTLRVDGTVYTRIGALPAGEVDLTGFSVINQSFPTVLNSSVKFGLTAVYKNGSNNVYGSTGVANSSTSLVSAPIVTGVTVSQVSDPFTNGVTGDITMTVSGKTGSNNFLGYKDNRLNIYWGYKDAIELVQNGSTSPTGVITPPRDIVVGDLFLNKIDNPSVGGVLVQPNESNAVGATRSYNFTVTRSKFDAEDGREINFYAVLFSDVANDSSLLKSFASYKVQSRPSYGQVTADSLLLALTTDGKVTVKVANVDGGAKVNFGLGATSMTKLATFTAQKIKVDAANTSIAAIKAQLNKFLLDNSEPLITANDITTFSTRLSNIYDVLSSDTINLGALKSVLNNVKTILSYVHSSIALNSATFTSLSSLLIAGAFKTAVTTYSGITFVGFEAGKLAFANAALKYFGSASVSGALSNDIKTFGTAEQKAAYDAAVALENGVTVTLGYYVQDIEDTHYVAETKNFTAATGPLKYSALFDTTSSGGYKLPIAFTPNSNIHVWVESIVVKSLFNNNLSFKIPQLKVNSVDLIKNITYNDTPGKVVDLNVKRKISTDAIGTDFKFSFKETMRKMGDMPTSYKITFKRNGSSVLVGQAGSPDLAYYITSSSLRAENEIYEVSVTGNAIAASRGSVSQPLNVTTTSGAPNTITTPIGSYAYGDLIEVNVVTMGNQNGFATESEPVELFVVPAAPATIDSIVITTPYSDELSSNKLDDLVTYTIINNGSTITSLFALDVFGNLLSAEKLEPVTTFTFSTNNINGVLTNTIGTDSSNPWTVEMTDEELRTIDANIIPYSPPTRTINAGGVNGDYLVPDATTFNALSGQTQRFGAIVPTKTVLKIRYATTASKQAANGNAGLQAQFAVLSSAQNTISPSQSYKFGTV